MSSAEISQAANPFEDSPSASGSPPSAVPGVGPASTAPSTRPSVRNSAADPGRRTGATTNSQGLNLGPSITRSQYSHQEPRPAAAPPSSTRNRVKAAASTSQTATPARNLGPNSSTTSENGRPTLEGHETVSTGPVSPRHTSDRPQQGSFDPTALPRSYTEFWSSRQMRDNPEGADQDSRVGSISSSRPDLQGHQPVLPSNSSQPSSARQVRLPVSTTPPVTGTTTSTVQPGSRLQKYAPPVPEESEARSRQVLLTPPMLPPIVLSTQLSSFNSTSRPQPPDVNVTTWGRSANGHVSMQPTLPRNDAGLQKLNGSWSSRCLECMGDSRRQCDGSKPRCRHSRHLHLTDVWEIH